MANVEQSDVMPTPDMSADEFRDVARTYLGRILGDRTAESAVSVLGAGTDDLEEPRQFLARLARDGWSVPTWPLSLGGVGLGAELASIWQKELSAFSAPDLYPFRIGLNMVGPTVLRHGTPAQQQDWLPKIATGEEVWCQLFSEPGSGSDLAGLGTMARRIRDEWEISGQKVWSSRAHYAQWGLLLARCDAGAQKHAGIVCFGLPMDAAGVEVRPLRQMNGDAHFNEVFLDRVRIDDSLRIGEPGEGWSVARTTLGHEREAAGSGVIITSAQLVELARKAGLARDPVTRDQLVRTIIELEVARLAAERTRSLPGGAGPLGSASKLRSVGALKRASKLIGRMLGMEVTAFKSDWQTLLLTVPSLSIRGGTNEIQKDILAERVLGLPKEPDPYRGRPWREIPRS